MSFNFFKKNNKFSVMDLPKIAQRVFGDEYLSGSASRIPCKTNKKIFLLEVREWLQEFLNDISTHSSLSIATHVAGTTTPFSEAMEQDTRIGRIGGNSVYFTLDRSFGIVAINQEGLNVVAACRFASVSASCGVYQGKWMYELHLGSKGIMQIGWCSNLCVFTIDRGCGDTQNSYAFDGSRIKTWNMLSREYGELWKTGDVIGICINLDDANIEFFRNGHSMGIAFSDIATGSGIIYLPCVSLVEGETVYANFGARPFRYPNGKYEPLQQKPHSKICQSEYILKWIKNLVELTTPNEPNIADCEEPGDISDRLFWNRLYCSLCYYLNIMLLNRYCLFNNFLPFIDDICGLKGGQGNGNLDKFFRVMDELWLYVKERNMEKTLYQIFSYLTNTFKQVSEVLNCPVKIHVLKVLQTFMSHCSTRKYIIRNLIFDRLDVFAFMHHKPLDEKFLNDVVGDSWWDTKGLLPDVEKNKNSFKTNFLKIERSYDEMEVQQCEIIKLLLINTDGTDMEPSSRTMFLKKLRKFCWQELECSRNDLNSKLPSSIAYASLLTMKKVLLELWKGEVGNELVVFPPRCFYDHTFKYSNCDRIGGLEQFLVHTFHDELVTELGEDHLIFNAEVNRTPTVPLQELRTIGTLINILESNESVIENFIMPTTSNGPFYQALFAPFMRDNQDTTLGNMDNKLSLLEFQEDLIMFFMSAVAKHCKKISKVQNNLEQTTTEFHIMYKNYLNLKKVRPNDDPLIINLENTMELHKDDINKRAKKKAWIEHVLLSTPRFQYFSRMFETLLTSISLLEKQNELFVFLPDFYFDACDIFIEVLLKDFNYFLNDPHVDDLLIKMAELMIHLLGDNRIRHIDCKKIPVNVLASFVTSQRAMKILESISTEKSVEFVQKLMVPYNERHWKASNWILVRFWHGTGYGFRYVNLPHHNQTDQPVVNQTNYIMYNIVPCPSPFYQNLVRHNLLDIEINPSPVPSLLDSIISELHGTFGEFLTPMQELQRAIERNEQLLMMGRLYKMCSTYFDKTIGLLRVLDMFISVAPEVFLESYYPESTAFTRRIIQVVLLIIHRISSKNGCFRIVMNSRIAVLENVEYFPIESACVAILLGILHQDMERYSEEDIIIPLFCRMVLTDPSYDYENLNILIGSTQSRNSAVVSLYDYASEMMLESELEDARKMLKMLEIFQPKLSTAKVIPEDELCTICYSAAYDVKFYPCNHNSCLSCISYYITKNRQCFFCKRQIIKVLKIADNTVIDSLTDREIEATTA